jgi:hypothetical protein
MAELGPPGTETGSTVKGVSVVDTRACDAAALDKGSKALLNRWVALINSWAEGTITQEENEEGLALMKRDTNGDGQVDAGQCGFLSGGMRGIVVQLDGLDYLVDYCWPGYCLRVIQKAEGFTRDK